MFPLEHDLKPKGGAPESGREGGERNPAKLNQRAKTVVGAVVVVVAVVAVGEAVRVIEILLPRNCLSRRFSLAGYRHHHSTGIDGERRLHLSGGGGWC